MDIHRCRFVPYPSSSINALAFSHPSPLGYKSGIAPRTLRLAIGRANGDIEIWNPNNGAWFQESILRGGKDRSIESLVWTLDPFAVDANGNKTPGRLRLFSIGYSATVTEWDLAAGKPLRHSTGYSGEIWCIAAQPRDSPPGKTPSRTADEQLALEQESMRQSLAVGCADGSIILLSTAEDDLRFHRILARPSKKNARVLSLTFQSRHKIVAGYSDSCVRIYDVQGRQPSRFMTLGNGPKGGPKEIFVWSVACMRKGTIVTGDSTGAITFWDGRFYTLLQRIRVHEADILALAISGDDKSVFSGGMDRRTTLYKSKTDDGQAKMSGWSRWAEVGHQRFHKNDIKAMATYDSKRLSVLVSGGADTQPILVPIRQFGTEYHRALSSLPQLPPMVSVSSKRILVSWWDREVQIWSVAHRAQPGLVDFDDTLGRGRALLSKMILDNEESITSADVSADGRVLVVSTIADIKLFRLSFSNGSLKVRKITSPTSLVSGARFLQFSPDSRWLLLVDTLNEAHLLRLISKIDDLDETPGVARYITKLYTAKRGQDPGKPLEGDLAAYRALLLRAAFSSDSKIVAIADTAGCIHTWVLEGQEDLTLPDGPQNEEDDASDISEEEEQAVLFGQRWITNPRARLMPKLSASPLAMSFRPSCEQPVENGSIALHPTRHNPHPHSHELPSGEDRLVVIDSQNELREFHVLSGRLSDWSRRNPPSSFPFDYRQLKDRAKGLVWDLQDRSERIWVYGAQWLCMIDLSRDFPQASDHTHSSNGLVKRKRDSSPNFLDSRAPKRDTGAGSKIADEELNFGIPANIQRIETQDGEEVKLLALGPSTQQTNGVYNSSSSSTSESGDEDEDGQDASAALTKQTTTALLALRRKQALANGHSTPESTSDSDVSGNDSHDDGDGDNDENNLAVARRPKSKSISRSKARSKPHFWMTYKYRPILGIAPLSGHPNANGGNSPVEVALVERPLWEMALPPRFHGEHEWNDT